MDTRSVKARVARAPTAPARSHQADPLCFADHRLRMPCCLARRSQLNRARRWAQKQILNAHSTAQGFCNLQALHAARRGSFAMQACGVAPLGEIYTSLHWARLRAGRCCPLVKGHTTHLGADRQHALGAGHDGAGGDGAGGLHCWELVPGEVPEVCGEEADAGGATRRAGGRQWYSRSTDRFGAAITPALPGNWTFPRCTARPPRGGRCCAQCAELSSRRCPHTLPAHTSAPPPRSTFSHTPCSFPAAPASPRPAPPAAAGV